MSVPVTVLIDTYNHECYVEQAIVSAIEQDFPATDYEILVVDDGSTDRTPDIVRKFGPRVRLIQKRNGGQASAFNVGIPEARGEIIAFLDGDDWFAPGKLTAVMTALGQHPEAAAVGHGYYKFRQEGNKIEVYLPPQVNCLDFKAAAWAREAMRAWRSLLMGALTVRKQLIRDVIPISESLVFCADTPIQAAALAGGVVVLQEPLFYYRHHEGSLYSFDRQNLGKMRRRLEVHQLALEASLRTLIQKGVPVESVYELIRPAQIHDARIELTNFGGSRLKTLRTEFQALCVDNRNAGIVCGAFARVVLVIAALLVPARTFYNIRNLRLTSRLWYRFMGGTYAVRHAIGLNRRRAAESGTKAGDSRRIAG